MRRKEREEAKRGRVRWVEGEGSELIIVIKTVLVFIITRMSVRVTE
jgi:hypothetical protein